MIKFNLICKLVLELLSLFKYFICIIFDADIVEGFCMCMKNVYRVFLLLAGINLTKIYAAPGAGGLPYCMKDGEVLFLIGQDPEGWSDFGGMAEKGETVLQTAAREFSEETKNVFDGGSEHNNAKFFNQHNRGSLPHPKFKYFSHLIEVSYIPADVFKRSKGGPHAEKLDYAWIHAGEFLRAVSSRAQASEAQFTFQGKKFRSCFIGTVQHNLEKIVGIIFGGESQLHAKPKAAAYASDADYKKAVRCSQETAAMEEAQRLSLLSETHPPAAATPMPIMAASQINNKLDVLSNMLYEASIKRDRGAVRDILDQLMRVPDVHGIRSKKEALIHETLLILES